MRTFGRPDYRLPKRALEVTECKCGKLEHVASQKTVMMFETSLLFFYRGHYDNFKRELPKGFQ